MVNLLVHARRNTVRAAAIQSEGFSAAPAHFDCALDGRDWGAVFGQPTDLQWGVPRDHDGTGRFWPAGILWAGGKARIDLFQGMGRFRRAVVDREHVLLPLGRVIIFVLGLCVRQFVSTHNTAGILAISTTLFGLMYVPWLLNFIQKINFFPKANGTFYVLYFILVTKFSDTGAYAVGSLIGKHKMIPRISPGKTWEGFAGAVAVSTLASLLFAYFTGERLTGMNWKHAVILGILLSTSAVIGDLIESLFKREAGVKDSGQYFPGIGGILDLLDSLLFNAPLMYLYLRHVLTRP
ncbi:MAG: hypothetical protein DME23_16325 [Verrucomicrobia bacterium]|nr:MAG: hypothetical protein DME23_16325 [Verrucomicrobiota bacterium]